MIEEKKDTYRKFQIILSAIAMVIASAAVVVTIYKTIYSNSHYISTRQGQNIIYADNELLNILVSARPFGAHWGVYDNAWKGEDVNIRHKYNNLKDVVIAQENIDKRIRSIESAIMSNPESALSIPVLRKDLEMLKLQYKEHKEETSKHIDRIYDQNKWFLGLMFTMAIGIIGLAISNFLK